MKQLTQQQRDEQNRLFKANCKRKTLFNKAQMLEQKYGRAEY